MFCGSVDGSMIVNSCLLVTYRNTSHMFLFSADMYKEFFFLWRDKEHAVDKNLNIN